MADEQKKLTTLEQAIAAIENLEDAMSKLIDIVADYGKKLEVVQGATVQKKGMFGGKRERVAIKDTKTGAVYPSQAAVTKQLAGEFGLSATDHFACYKIFAKEPNRFIRMSGAEAEAVWKAEEERVAKEVADSNAKLAAEQAAKDAKAKADAEAAAKAGTTTPPAQQPPAQHKGGKNK